MPALTPSRWNLVRICLASAGWAFHFGLGSQVTTQWLRDGGASDTVIGLNHASYYLGIALAALATGWLTQRLGRACAPLGMVLSGLTLAAFPWCEGPFGWFLLRWLNGAASALSLIPLETIVSQDAPAGAKARHFGCYGVSLTLGGALGIWLGLHAYAAGAVAPFLKGAVPPLLGALLLVVRMTRTPTVVNPNAAGQVLAWPTRFLSYGTAWSQGFLEGGMLAFLALYLLSRGFSADAAGGLMAVTMFGVVLFQVPVGWLADRLGRTPVLLGCYGVVGGTLLAVPGCESEIVLASVLFLFGACCGAMYPLGLALLGDGDSERALSKAYAWYLALECLGSQIGAVAMGRVRDTWGEDAMFPLGSAALGVVMLAWIAMGGLRQRMGQESSEPAERRAA